MNYVQVPGRISFDPPNVTKKHELQAEWKKVAFVLVDGEICDYYAWFLKKRFNLILNPPLRGAHVSFINDSFRDMAWGTFNPFSYGFVATEAEIAKSGVEQTWEKVRKKYENAPITLTLNTSPRTDDKHWWLNIPNEHRDELHAIRKELGLSRPHWGLHMSIGYANEKNIEHSKYIHTVSKRHDL